MMNVIKNGAAEPVKRTQGEMKVNLHQNSRKQKIVLETSSSVNNFLKLILIQF